MPAGPTVFCLFYFVNDLVPKMQSIMAKVQRVFFLLESDLAGVDDAGFFSPFVVIFETVLKLPC